jgi:hypothetical protein
MKEIFAKLPKDEKAAGMSWISLVKLTLPPRNALLS